MELNEVILFASAVIPSVALCIYVFKKDRAEKEPLSLLLKLFLFGIISCFPVISVSEPLCNAIDGIFAKYCYVDGDTLYYTSTSALYAYNAATYFIGVALVEELGKFVFLWIGSRKSREFNSLFDGIIYSVFVSLGFATLENVLYVFEGGLGVALLRAVLSVPGHMFFGVLMGYYYSLYHITETAKEIEKVYQEQCLIQKKPPLSSKKYLFMSLFAPIMAHGAYDFCCTIGSGLMTAVFVILIVFLYVYCFGKIKKISVCDAPTNDYAKLMLINKYPELRAIFQTF